MKMYVIKYSTKGEDGPAKAGPQRAATFVLHKATRMTVALVTRSDVHALIFDHRILRDRT